MPASGFFEGKTGKSESFVFCFGLKMLVTSYYFSEDFVMKIKNYLAISVSALALQTGALQAQEFYGGLMIAYSDGERTPQPGGFGAATNTSSKSASLLAGARFQSSSPLFYGIEAETTLGLDGTLGFGPGSTAEVTGQSRLRAVLGYNFSKFSAFAAIGAVRQRGSGTGGILSTSYDASGTSYGLGVEVPMSDKINLRGEILYDDTSASGYQASDFTSTTIRLGAIIKF